jgi:hypothetical protein
MPSDAPFAGAKGRRRSMLVRSSPAVFTPQAICNSRASVDMRRVNVRTVEGAVDAPSAGYGLLSTVPPSLRGTHPGTLCTDAAQTPSVSAAYVQHTGTGRFGYQKGGPRSRLRRDPHGARDQRSSPGWSSAALLAEPSSIDTGPHRAPIA